MADELDALLERIQDEGLRAELSLQIQRIRRRRKFGLVFEAHLPEEVRLPDHPIRRGVRVVGQDARPGEPPLTVLDLRGDKVLVDAGYTTDELDAAGLVVVAEFGQPIYPSFRRLGTVELGGDKPAHVVIKGENFHALEALRFTHAGKVDCIFIDPPYNNRSKDWKYNNDYVDKEDVFKHSKWLSMIHRRLLLARQLLDPERSVLIVSIDENEVNRLGLLLEQVFPSAGIQMVTSVVSAKGAVRPGRFSRVEEHLFFVTLGMAEISRWTQDMLSQEDLTATTDDPDELAQNEQHPPERIPIEWLGLRRREPSSKRGARPNQFFPIFVHEDTGLLHSVGDPLDDETDRTTVVAPAGTVALWPLKPDGTEMLWGLTPEVLRENWTQGFARVNNWRPDERKGTVKYLPGGTISKIRDGTIEVTGKRGDGSIEGYFAPDWDRLVPPKRVWHMASHNAEIGGTNVLSNLIPGRRFDYPKSIYAVEDALRFVVGNNPEAVVLDFFAGSGTTAHAVARLNRQDGGRRQSIIVTNNEVSAAEAEVFRAKGLRPGDPEWELLGIFEHITCPRITAAFTGRTPDGGPISGNYRFVDPFPMAEGFSENVEFLEMRYLDLEDVELDLAFEAIAPLLWLRSGGIGPMITERSEEPGGQTTFRVTERYGVLFDTDHWRRFVTSLPAGAQTVFIVTDSPSVFTAIASEIPRSVEAVRLYENYLATFALNRGP